MKCKFRTKCRSTLTAWQGMKEAIRVPDKGGAIGVTGNVKVHRFAKRKIAEPVIVACLK